MNSKNWRGSIKLSQGFKRGIRKGLSIALTLAMVAGNLAYANAASVDVYAAEKSIVSQATGDKTASTGEYTFGTGKKVSASTLYSADTGYGFSDVTYNEAAKDWVGGVYYPREAKIETGKASFVTEYDGYLGIKSRVWSESTTNAGYTTSYTYENTSTLDFKLDGADYIVKVNFTNPTSAEYTASIEAEDITKVTGIKVAAGATATAEFTACLVDGLLNLKFLNSTVAASFDAATDNEVFVSSIQVTPVEAKGAGVKPTIFIASDSTVQTYDSGYYPQTGWGQTLHNFFGEFVEERESSNCGYSQSQTYETTNVIVDNRAIGGRSSMSFIKEGKYDDLLEDIRPGDYVLIQWGHNDATTSRPERYVSPTDFEYWMQYYVDGAIQRGATPVLVTPVARYSYTTKEDGSLNSFVGNFEAYGDVMREMAAEQNIPIVDLTARSTALCNEFGIEGSKSLFLIVAAGDYPQGSYAGGANDATHLQYYGAYKFAQCVAQGIVEYNATNALKDLAALVVNRVPDSVPGVIANFKSTTVGASSVSMTWDAEADSELYYIYRAVLKEGQTVDDVDFSNATRYSVSSMNKYTDTACESGVTYVYAVQGFNPKGVGELSEKIVVTTKTAGWRFDINAVDGGPTEEGWTGIGTKMYDATVGYGWKTYPGGGRDRGTRDDLNLEFPSMARDFTLGVGEFALDLPNGDYEVSIFGGDILAGTSTQKTSYTAEGKSVGSISVKEGVAAATNTIRVEDGQLNIRPEGSGLVYFNGFTVTEILKAPSGVVAFEKTAVGSNMSFLLNFETVDDAAGYNIYQKSTSDESFSLVKTFTKEEFAADDLACKAISVVLGETYEYYMTCYTADGSESARSNIEKVEAVVNGVTKPAAPTNVVCVDPTTATNGVQSTITISWDAAKVEDAATGAVIKYIIYRSDKAENEKGFSGFEKVGETVGAATTFTDTYHDLDTNISYYYKVAALNAGGLGETSAVCKTPVTGALAPQYLEKYADRALVGVNLAGDAGAEVKVTATDSEGNPITKGVYLSWRSFEADFDAAGNQTTTFDVYRDGVVIANDIKYTNLVDEAGTTASVYKVVGSNDAAIGVNSVDTKCWEKQYLSLELFCPANETMPDGSTCNFTANDMSVGDLDGDGDLEIIVKWYPSNAKDNSGYGYTGKTYLDAYDVNFATGEVELLYRIDMGINIRSGAHYTQFQVWDYDGDGKAEIAVKTAPGTTVLNPTDGTAATLTETAWIDVKSSDLPTSVVSDANDYRNTDGFVLDGPEYLTMFNGEDGSILDTADYTPKRGSVGAWGDGYGNRVDRFLSATAYLDGEIPYAVFCRGYYTRTCLTAYYYDKESGEIKEYWAFDTNIAGTQYEAEGNHGLSVNDIDNDGKDEIIYGALVVDHDGTVKYATGLGHGDAMHVSDWVSWNDGLEIMSVHEHDNVAYHVEVRDAETGEILMGYYTGKDTGRGVMADIDPTAEGAEWWSIASPTYESNDEPAWDSLNGEVYSSWSKLGALIKLADSTPASNASMFWDGDLLSEIQDHRFNAKDAYNAMGATIYKWDYEKGEQVAIFDSSEVFSTNGTKGNFGLVADVFGDWREEIFVREFEDVYGKDGNPNVVRVYTTTIQTDYVVPCLLENLAYREGVAWQNVGYNQPANLSYLLSEGLVTAELTLGELAKDSVEIIFSEANDGTYGHDIEGYEIYRAEGDGEFELIDIIELDQLIETEPPVKEPELPDGGEDEANKVLYSEDFEDEKHDWTYYAAGAVSLAADKATKNANTSDYILGVGSDVRDRRIQSPALGVTANATVEFDFRIDAPYNAKSSSLALLGAANSDKENNEWLQSEAQILTIQATTGSNTATWGSIKINGTDVTAALTADVTESSTGKLATTGWLKLKAELDFEKQTVKFSIRKVSDGTVVYNGETSFLNTGITGLAHIFAAANKSNGGVYIDNVVVTDGFKDADVIGYQNVVYKQFDSGNRETAPEGFIAMNADAYSASKGYGFTSDTSKLDLTRVGIKVTLEGETATPLEVACGDFAFSSDGIFEYAIDVPAGKYIVDVYAGNGANNNTYNTNSISINGTDFGTVSKGPKAADMLKTTELTFEKAGQIVVAASNTAGGRAFLNAIVITEVAPITEFDAAAVAKPDAGEEETTTEAPSTEAPSTEAPTTAPSEGETTTEADKEIIGYKEVVYKQFDAGTRTALPDGFIQMDAVEYSSTTGYGYTSSLTTLDFSKGSSITIAGDTATLIEQACQDFGYSTDGTLEYTIDAPAGTYIVNVYAGYGANSTTYNYTTIYVNGTDLGTVSKSASVAEIVKTAEVVLEADGQIVVKSVNTASSPRAFLNAIVINQKVPVYADDEQTSTEAPSTEEPTAPSEESPSTEAPSTEEPSTEAPTTAPSEPEVETKTVYTEDFEDGASDFVLISSGNAANEYLEKDTSTVNANTSNYVYGVGSRSGGDTGTQKSGLGITSNVTVELDVKLDACNQDKSSNFALLGSKESNNWLTNTAQILTISAKASGNGYWGSITLNGTDITEKANVSNGAANGESSGKGGLTRDTSGWLHLTAAIDFANQKVNVTLTRISDSSVVYSGEVAFVSTAAVNTLDSIYMAAGKVYGGIFVDNINIYEVLGATEEPSTEAPSEEETTAAPAEPEVPSEEETTAPTEPEAATVSLHSEDFEDGTNDLFSLKNSANADYEFLEADAATLNKNNSKYIYGVSCLGSRNGDVSTSTKALEVTSNATVEFDFRMDSTAGGKSEQIALLGAPNASEWLNCSETIWAINVAGNGSYFNSITVTNGAETVDITSAITASDAAENSGKSGSTIATTGWIHFKAELDFANQKLNVTLTRVSDGSQVYAGEVAFVNTTDSLEHIFMSANRVNGTTCIDNVNIYEVVDSTDVATLSLRDKTTVAAARVLTDPNAEPATEEAIKYYQYIDTTVEANTSYTYKIAAIVDGKTSFMSESLNVTTLVDIKEVPDFELDNLVQDQVLAEGQTIADLLPAQIKVIDADGNEAMANAKWIVSALDITTPGTYEVTAVIAGWSEAIVKNVVVVPNVSTGYAAIEDISVIIGTEAVLPTTVTATFLNGKTVVEAVTWDTTTLDTATLGEYVVKGTYAGANEATVKVIVIPDYIVSLNDKYVEVALEDVDYTLPTTVTAVWGSGKTTDVAVTWDTTTVDTTVLGTTVINGTVEGVDAKAVLNVVVDYPVVKRFDFGIEASRVADGWIGITSDRDGTKTVAEFGIEYTEEKGYGFTDPTLKVNGRNEVATQLGLLPENVYQDFLMPTGSFQIDVPNGTYEVEVISTCMTSGSSTVNINVDGTILAVKCNKSYTVEGTQVVVEDGSITLTWTAALSRTGGIIIRSVPATVDEPGEDPTLPEDPSETLPEEPTEKPSEDETEGPTTEEPSVEEPTETPSVEEPTEEPSVEEPTEAPSVEEPTAETPSTEAPTQAPIVSTDKPVVEIVINQQIDADALENAFDTVVDGGALKVTVNNSQVVVSKDVFEKAVEKAAELIFDCGRYAWKFSELAADNITELKSLNVDVDAKIEEIEQVLNSANVPTEDRRTVSFEHDGNLPGKAEVTIDVSGKFENGKELFFYYFNEVSKGFELVSKNIVANGRVSVELRHCSDYVITETELPAEIVITASTSDAETGDNSPIMVYTVLAFMAAIMLAGYAVYDHKRKFNR